MKKLYKTSILPFITYACSVWFFPDPQIRWHLQKSLVRVLERLQYIVLLHVSGAMKGTSSMLIQKELGVIPISVYLQGRAVTHRAYRYGTSIERRLNSMRHEPFPGRTVAPDVYRHPYEVCYEYAAAVRADACRFYYGGDVSEEKMHEWMTGGGRRREIRLYVRTQVFLMCKKLWRKYQESHRRRPSPFMPEAAFQNTVLALQGDWDLDNWKLYQGYTRCTTTMMMQARTGVMSLNAFLYWIKVSTSPCPLLPHLSVLYAHSLIHHLQGRTVPCVPLRLPPADCRARLLLLPSAAKAEGRADSRAAAQRLRETFLDGEGCVPSSQVGLEALETRAIRLCCVLPGETLFRAGRRRNICASVGILCLGFRRATGDVDVDETRLPRVDMSSYKHALLLSLIDKRRLAACLPLAGGAPGRTPLLPYFFRAHPA